MGYGFSGWPMAIGTADDVVWSKQKAFAISCTESAKDPLNPILAEALALKSETKWQANLGPKSTLSSWRQARCVSKSETELRENFVSDFSAVISFFQSNIHCIENPR
jgi:hypothetical protein